MKKKLLRALGILLGIFSVLVGINLFINPVFDTVLEKINAITFIIVGTIFIIYGIKGRLKSLN